MVSYWRCCCCWTTAPRIKSCSHSAHTHHIPWFEDNEGSNKCTGGTSVAVPGVCPCSWNLDRRCRKLVDTHGGGGCSRVPPGLSSLKPLFLAALMTEDGGFWGCPLRTSSPFNRSLVPNTQQEATKIYKNQNTEGRRGNNPSFAFLHPPHLRVLSLPPLF